jgi:tetratricopeptide (TPR) repeat protein
VTVRAQGLLAGALGATLSGLGPAPALAFSNVASGQPVGDDELPTLDGGRAALWSPRALANVFVFFRPGQEHSLSTLRAMAECEREFEKRPVRWVAVVSGDWPRQEVLAAVVEAGVRFPVIVDAGDELYGRLGVRLHPVVGIADERGRLLDYVHFRKVNYCDMVRIRIRRALKEVDQAAVDRIDHPPRALTPNEIPGAVAKRHLRLGEGLLERKQWQKAAEEARVAIERSPDLAAAHVLLGKALAAAGRCPEAARSFDEALRLEPGNRAAAEGRKACAGTR